MKIVPIFADTKRKPPEGLFSVCIDPEKDQRDEFKILDDNLSDPEFLRNFFNKREAFIGAHPFHGSITVREAIRRTRNEYFSLLRIFKDLAEEGITDEELGLVEIFKPLKKSEIFKPQLQKEKAKSSYKSWIRVYALRVAQNFYIVTGGGIKLYKTMQEDEYLKTQLAKIELVKQFLIENEMYDPEGFQELEF
jgi:hypothetical protein